MLEFSNKANETINKYLSIWETNKLAIGVIFRDGTQKYYNSPDATLTTPFDIGSISKTFTAALVLKLLSEEKISLDDRADKFIENLPKGVYPKVSQLLTHTAGYGHLTPLELTLPALIKKPYQKANPYRGVSDKDVIKCLARRNHSKDNYTYGYSDFPYAVLALIASRVAHEDFSNLLNSFINNDLGLNDTYVAKPDLREISYFKGKPIKSWHWNDNNPYISGGGIVSNIIDMTHYAALQLKEEQDYLKSAHAIWADSFSKRGNIGSCLGWHTYKDSDQLWHVGGVGTYRASMIFNVKKGVAVIVLGNSKGKRCANVHYLAKLLYSDIRRNKLK